MKATKRKEEENKSFLDHLGEKKKDVRDQSTSSFVFFPFPPRKNEDTQWTHVNSSLFLFLPKCPAGFFFRLSLAFPRPLFPSLLLPLSAFSLFFFPASDIFTSALFKRCLVHGHHQERERLFLARRKQKRAEHPNFSRSERGRQP